MFLHTKKLKYILTLLTGSPYISIDIYLTAKTVSVNNGANYLDEDYLNEIMNSTNNYLSSHISAYLYKTSVELKSCIDNFDQEAVHGFLTTSEWDAYDWESNYPNSFFDIEITTNVNSSLLLTEG